MGRVASSAENGLTSSTVTRPLWAGRRVKSSALESDKGSTAMIAQQRSARLRTVGQVSKSMDTRSDRTDLTGRLIQMALALYLVPVLLIVLVVGGVGMLVLAVGRSVTGLMQRSVS
jgi:hypothetical protein